MLNRLVKVILSSLLKKTFHDQGCHLKNKYSWKNIFGKLSYLSEEHQITYIIFHQKYSASKVLLNQLVHLINFGKRINSIHSNHCCTTTQQIKSRQSQRNPFYFTEDEKPKDSLSPHVSVVTSCDSSLPRMVSDGSVLLFDDSTRSSASTFK